MQRLYIAAFFLVNRQIIISFVQRKYVEGFG